MAGTAAPAPSTPLGGAALGALCKALVGAFTVDELFEAALVDVDLDLFAVIGPRETPLETLTLAFLTGLERRGAVPRFLRGARRRRPDNAALITAITLHCPEALQDEPPAAARVRILVDALDLMRAHLADPGIATPVGASQGELASLADRLARLRTYKGLHDTLQDFQVGQFSSLSDNVRRLRDDPRASVILRDLLAGLVRTFQNARMTLTPLQAAQDDVEEKNCIDAFVAAFAAIGQARERLDDRAARRALLIVRGLLQSHPNRINGALRTEARRLPLQRLSEAIMAAAGAPGLSAAQRTSLEEGARSVEELRLRLTRSVVDHDRWQAVERTLWFLDDTADRGDGAIEDFRDYWDVAKESVAPLWSADVRADWVVATETLARAIDAALLAVPPDAPRARLSYGDFRHAAMWRFYEVDRELRVLCEDVLQIGGPVAALVK